MSDQQQPALVWFRKDLRLADNPALLAAARSGRPVIPLFIENPNPERDLESTGVVGQWIMLNAAALDNSLKKEYGSRLVFLRGSLTDELFRLARNTGSAALYFCTSHEPGNSKLEDEILHICRQEGIEPFIYQGNRLSDPGEVTSGTGDPYKVFGPFSRKFNQVYSHVPPQPAPESLITPEVWPESVEQNRIGHSTNSGPVSRWEPGEQAAQNALKNFVSTLLKGYVKNRDLLAPDTTSKLSVYLNCGAISVRQIWDSVLQHLDGGTEESAASYLRQLIWREFSYITLQTFPELPDQPYREDFTAFPWTDSSEFLERWQTGQTGYPVVDAAMRQLMTEGWMPGRARMVAASFLTKHLLVNWVAGERWFRIKLVDADLACNAFNWQWVAGCGLDAAPYFRIFNPVTQGQKFDNNGDYVRRFVPEISALPDKYIHNPWTAPSDVLQNSGISLGTTYPQPVVDHAQARQEALAAYSSLKHLR